MRYESLGRATSILRVMEGFVVDADTGSRASGGEEVDGHPGEDLVIRPGITICPIVQLFIDPGQEANGAVCE